MKGLVVLLQPVETVASQSLIVGFVSLALVLAIAVGVALRLSVRAFDVSKIYYPTIIGACLGALVVLVLGGGFGAVQGIVVNTIYNVFAIIVWMLLSELSSRTSLSPIKVFGLGRGMSAIGTTLGWYVASGAASSAEDTTLFFSVLFALMLVVILAVVMLVFDERTISLALEKAIKDKEKAAGASGPDPSGVPSERVCDTSASATWEEACEAVSSRFGLTARESEVAALLGRGRTVGYVADELGISHNTVKGYIKNVYAKCDVHSRQDLIDLIESFL